MPTTHREPLCLSDGVTIVQDRLADGLSRSYPTFIAHTGSCAGPKSSCQLRFTYFGRSLQVATSPCWKMALPDVISADLSPDAWTPTPAALMVHSLVSSHEASAFPTLGTGRRFGDTHTATPVWTQFRGCSHSLMFRPPGLLAPQVAPTVDPFGAEAARASTSGHTTARCLPAVRIC
jgi:hypothetical protein